MRRILTILFALIGAVNIEATDRQKLNVFDKPNEQSDARIDSAMARKGRAKLNFIKPNANILLFYNIYLRESFYSA